MASSSVTAVERIQTIAARMVGTHPVGHGLCLIGGFRYRLLNGSARASRDIDYHWEGDLERKQAELVDVFRRKLLPEVQRQLRYDGDVRPAAGPQAESPAVRIVELAFYRVAEPGSRLEIPVEITTVTRFDPPVVRTKAGTVFLTLSEADMIESKILAFLERHFVQVRDVLDIFFFQDGLPPDAPVRLSQKLRERASTPADAIARLDRLRDSRPVYVRGMERLLEEQVDPTVAANLRLAGGAAMIWDSVLRLLYVLLAKAGEHAS
jgi:hypothetical protein